MINDYPFTLAAGQRSDIMGPLRSIRLMSTSGEIIIEVENKRSSLVAGRAITFDVPIEECAIINETGSSVTGILSLGARAVVSDNILSGIVSTVKPTVIDTVPDVALAAGVATMVLPADTARREALVTNLAGNASNIRFGDVNVGAARGAQCGVGQTATVQGTEAIYAYSTTAQGVGVTVIKD